ncbi:MAG: L,D-transpeptidase [Verrucomicrobiae bacterium]|nr:L,D-transpeptidase [Verrucomicrobiae bacterium]
MKGLPQAFLEHLGERGVARTARVLIVRPSNQTLLLFENGRRPVAWPVSTAEKGLGEKQHSYQTPRGLHRIRKKIGAGLPKGAIFDSREFQGEIWRPPPPRPPPPFVAVGRAVEALPPLPDVVTSRILWLEGLEPGKNAGADEEGTLVDSYERYIYIHGTNSEKLVGKPVSRGCIRMHNDAVIALFDRVELGDLVWIEDTKGDGRR